MKHRCTNCNKLLAVGCGEGKFEIKCPRCKQINSIGAAAHNSPSDKALLPTLDDQCVPAKPETAVERS